MRLAGFAVGVVVVIGLVLAAAVAEFLGECPGDGYGACGTGRSGGGIPFLVLGGLVLLGVLVAATSSTSRTRSSDRPVRRVLRAQGFDEVVEVVTEEAAAAGADYREVSRSKWHVLFDLRPADSDEWCRMRVERHPGEPGLFVVECLGSPRWPPVD